MRSDLNAITALIWWMRDEGIAWSELTMDGVHIVGTDSNVILPESERRPTERPRSIYDEYAPPPTDLANPNETALVDES